MRRIFVAALLALLARPECAAQDKPVVAPAPDLKRIVVSFKSGEPIPAQFVPKVGDAQRYRLVELEPKDVPGAVSADRTAWIDPVTPAVCTGFNCQALQLSLAQELSAGQTYILAISEFTSAGAPITLRFVVAPPPPPPRRRPARATRTG